jgi:hypothetical protein
MRTFMLAGLVALGTAGCAAGISSGAGAGGAEVVSGETQIESALTGAATNSPATNGSVTTGEAIQSGARPRAAPVIPAGSAYQ